MANIDRIPPPKLRSWSELSEDVSGLPMSVSAALMSSRTELLKLVKPEDFDSPESRRALVNLIRVLLDTNRELQRHAAQCAEMTENLRGHLKGFARNAAELHDFANFREPLEYDPDDD